MKRKNAFALSVLCLAVLTAFSVPLLSSKGVVCMKRGGGHVLASVVSDSLSAVSGTDLYLSLSLDNRGRASYEGGEVIVSAAREAQRGDSSLGNDFLVLRSVVGTGVSLASGEVRDIPYTWRIPASLPTGVYSISAAYKAGGSLFEGGDASKTPFGGDARVRVQGESASPIYFIGSGAGNDEANMTLVNTSRSAVTVPVVVSLYEGGLGGRLAKTETVTASVAPGAFVEVPYSYPEGDFGLVAESAHRGVPAVYVFSTPRAHCPDAASSHLWLATIGALGVAMLLLVRFRRERTI